MIETEHEIWLKSEKLEPFYYELNREIGNTSSNELYVNATEKRNWREILKLLNMNGNEKIWVHRTIYETNEMLKINLTDDVHMRELF